MINPYFTIVCLYGNGTPILLVPPFTSKFVGVAPLFWTKQVAKYVAVLCFVAPKYAYSIHSCGSPDIDHHSFVFSQMLGNVIIFDNY